MSNTEVDEKINLNDIVDISEDEFKKQISAWIDERGISRKLQSKLRADLFEQFNRTKLGRQMTEQHQHAHRIVLSPLILVLNTLVAEFLYNEDCHFTLSVFANEVPYKNTLPNFEETPSRQLFRFSKTELNAIFEAIGISKMNEQLIRELYVKIGGANGQEALNKSLLYCIFKILISRMNHQSSETNSKINTKTKTKKPKPSTSKITVSKSSQQSADRSPQSDKKTSSSSSTNTHRVKCDSLQISSRYFKYLNRYLEILSDRINEMSKCLIEKSSGSKFRKTATDSSTQEESIRKDLRKIIHNINKLSKSQHKSRRFQDVLNTIERLSASVEKCSGKLEELLMAVNVQTKGTETVEKKTSNKNDRFSEMDYGSWLKELKTSEHGRKFIDKLEVSLQKTMEKERENLDKIYEEKTNNYRMLIRLHYKQKYDMNKSDSELKELVEKNDSNTKITPDDTEKEMAETLAKRTLEKDKQVDEIVQTAKVRLQQLERESEDLDQSFQAYLRRQQILKQQMNIDASKIWENYSLSKAALVEFDKTDVHTHSSIYQPKFNDSLQINQVFNSTFYDDVNIADVLKDLNEIKQLKSPQFNKNVAFPKNHLLTLKSQKKNVEPLINYNEKWFEKYSRGKKREKTNPNLSIPFSISTDTKITNSNQNHGQIVQNGYNKSNTHGKSTEDEPNVIATSALNKKELKSNQNDELDKQIDLEEKIVSNSNFDDEKSKIVENDAKESINKSIGQDTEQDIETKDQLQPESSKLTNGHVKGIGIGIDENNSKDNKTTEEKNESTHLFSPLKINGFDKIIETISRTHKNQPTAPTNHDSKKTPKIVTNGFGAKSLDFVSKISDGESVELDSDQISIGQQRLIKSPDDFWI